MIKRTPVVSEQPVAFEEDYAALKELGESINEQTTLLNTKLQLFESRLTALNLGMAVHTEISTADDKATGRRAYLWYRKTGDGWGLTIRVRTIADSVEKEYPIAECNRSARRLAALHLHELVGDLLLAARAENDKLLEAVSKATTVTDWLPPTDDEPPF